MPVDGQLQHSQQPGKSGGQHSQQHEIPQEPLHHHATPQVGSQESNLDGAWSWRLFSLYRSAAYLLTPDDHLRPFMLPGMT
jgi:hypothetical protein